MPLDEVFTDLGASPNGLTSEEAKARLKKYGLNTLYEKKQTSFLYKFLTHFKDLFGILLLFASALSAISGSPELASHYPSRSVRQHFRQSLPRITCRKSHGDTEELDA